MFRDGAPETLAMHHLYVIKSSVDLTGDRGVDAYWRTAEHVDAFLDAQNECNGLFWWPPMKRTRPATVGCWFTKNQHPSHLAVAATRGVGRYSGLCMMPLPRSDYIHLSGGRTTATVA